MTSELLELLSTAFRGVISKSVDDNIDHRRACGKALLIVVVIRHCYKQSKVGNKPWIHVTHDSSSTSGIGWLIYN